MAIQINGINVIDNTRSLQNIVNISYFGEALTTSTSSFQVPAGTTAQRPTPIVGKIRYNTSLNQFEGYSSTGWGALGGGARGGPGNYVFYENDMNVFADYGISTGTNAMTAGPVTVNTGTTVTIPTGSVWTVV